MMLNYPLERYRDAAKGQALPVGYAGRDSTNRMIIDLVNEVERLRMIVDAAAAALRNLEGWK